MGAIPTPLRLAMWSGPRNVSTALLRSWGNRVDTTVTDEPLYAHYLHVTGVDHPGRADVLAAQDTDWRAVVEHLTGPVPHGHTIWYQKHMTHHITDDVELGWLAGLRHCFLIRSPAEVIASYAKVRGEPTLADVGLPQQWRLFSHIADADDIPPVIDAADLLRDPRRVLTALCDAIGVAFTPRMLRWPRGSRTTDGVWAKHWYGAVEQSTGFAPYAPRDLSLDSRWAELLAAADDIYTRLAAHRLVQVEA